VSELHVHVFGQMVGTITRNDRIRNRINFTAEPHDLPFNVMSEGISLVPGSKPASSEQTTNFFGGYLPEGQHRTALAARAGVKENDAFGMLAQYGLTMSGAISIRSPEAQPSDDADYRELTSRQLVNKIADAIEKHDLGNEPDSGRSAIQGFQPKLVLARFDGKWHQPLGAAHSTHIIKPALRARPEGIVDEHYSHRLAKRTGLATFDTELIITHGVTFLAIQRYDREVTTAGILAAAHQEDAAQVMGLDWVDSLAKFQDAKSPKSGPSLRKIADIIGSSAHRRAMRTSNGGSATWCSTRWSAIPTLMPRMSHSSTSKMARHDLPTSTTRCRPPIAMMRSAPEIANAALTATWPLVSMANSDLPAYPEGI